MQTNTSPGGAPDTPAERGPSLAVRVAALAEVYQPIYGHPELSAAAVRPGADRLDTILAAHDALRGLLGRPLRVLDLGCAQGFFALNLAARGARVTAIDRDAASIAVCQALAAEHPGLALDFRHGQAVATLESLVAGDDSFDLALGLNVFHHLAHEYGGETVRAWLAGTRNAVGAWAVELALREEPLYWAPALPGDPAALLVDFAFVHQLGRFATHLSSLTRPLLIASDRYWLLPPLAGVIDDHGTRSHRLAGDHYAGTRHYYRSGDRLIKLYQYHADSAFDNRGDLAREAALLRQPPPGLRVPALEAYGEDDQSGWLVRERLPGTLLLDCLGTGAAPDPGPFLIAVLEQLAVLEEAGLYHGDLRAWNLLVLEGGEPALLDYGAIGPLATDCAWPGDPYLAVFILAHELLSGEVRGPEPLRPAAISPWRLPPPFRDWALTLWETPRAQWHFRDMRDRLEDLLAAPPPSRPLTSGEHWAAAIEGAIDQLSQTMTQRHWEQEQQTRLVDLSRDYARLEAWNREQQARQLDLSRDYARLEAWSQELTQAVEEQRRRAERAEAEGEGLRLNETELRRELAAARDEIAEQAAALGARIADAQRATKALQASLSWRLMAPLRRLGTLRVAWRRGRPGA